MPAKGAVAPHQAAPEEVQSTAQQLDTIAKWLKEHEHQEGAFADLAATIRLVSHRLSELARKEIERQRYIAEVNRAYQALRNDSEAWAAELRERGEWDCTLLDGLDSDAE